LRCSLHVFARRPGGDPTKVFIGDDVDGSDLKEAIMAKLKVDVSPDRLRVLLEVEGGLA
jgi:hypothetical protein